MFFRQVYDSALAQAAYFIGCQRTGEAIVIDPARDIDRYVALANAEGFTIVAAADTHIHADYLSGVREFVERLGRTGYVSDEGGKAWRYEWPRDGDDVVRLRHGDMFSIGHIDFRAVHTPGHTPEHLSFLVTDRGGGAEEPMGICTGDLLFVGDMGRPDLLDAAAGHVGTSEPAARALVESARALLAMEDYLQVWPGHGAGSACGKALGAVPQSTIGYERRRNPALARAGDTEAFVDFILEGQPEPPPYFARMKTENRAGPAPVVLASPQRVPVDRLSALAANTAVLDMRPTADFRAHHLPGSLAAPTLESVVAVAGSYLEPSDEIALITEESHLDDAIRVLVRIGYDRVTRYATPADIEACSDCVSLPSVDAREIEGAVQANAMLLDVRTANEHADGYVPGATNIAHTQLARRLAELPKDRPIYVSCETGSRSTLAASYLKRHGYDAVNVEGGFTAWRAHTASSLTERE